MRAHAERGFTLIEVVVAIVVAALVLSALAGVFAGGVRSAAAARDLAELAVAAESVLAGAGLERPLTDGTETGGDADRRFNWLLTIAPEPTTDSDNPIRPPLELKRLTVRVTREEASVPGQSPRSFELSTVRAVPRREP
ncbi:MAG: prepilin-type N-terminal cleavage/methylation domain-containing protein [Casimicrobiaceae bacterium]